MSPNFKPRISSSLLSGNSNDLTAAIIFHFLKKIMGWHHSGFSVHSKVEASTSEEAERVGKYMIRPILSLERWEKYLTFTLLDQDIDYLPCAGYALSSP